MRKPVLTYMPKGMVLTDEEFDTLHKRLNSTRSTSRTVTVPMEALRHILADHGALYGRLEEVDRTLRAGNGGNKLLEPPRPVELIAFPAAARRASKPAPFPTLGMGPGSVPDDDDDEDLIG